MKELLLQTPSPPAILLYDRYGYGDSDKPATPKIFNHDIRDSVDDLHEIIALFCTDYLQTSFSPQNMHLTIVAGSIGCMISRLYADKFPRTVSNLLLLDHGPILQDCPIPDPTTTWVTLPEGITAAMLRDARDKYYKGAYFHLAPNRERMSWKCLTEILRRPDTPSLKHPDGLGGPFITVLMHDGPTYAKQLSEVRSCDLHSHPVFFSFWWLSD
jgi:pimeloyl-ACP methyl ester carboxylesterase